MQKPNHRHFCRLLGSGGKRQNCGNTMKPRRLMAS
jgi:hypothetical protein